MQATSAETSNNHAGSIRIPELLAPAGGMEQLRAAVQFGADAVYLAAERFGMRARAVNFSMDELPQAVAIAHAAGAKVYVTCNILMFDRDIAALPAYLEAVAAAGVDALIVSDLGTVSLIKRYAPQVAIHVSTQASISNVEAAKVWHDLGASRIVCAREMSLEDIAAFKAGLPEGLEIEVFVHGAMCMAVSGRCLISSYLTGRSGNQGNCTQPCRWSYTLEEEKRPGEHFPIEEDDRGSYIMNARDLNMLAYIDQLAAAGVDSLKIEGRNKKAFYVASVVNAYRQVLDGASADDFADELLTVSHRPYSTGFFFGPAHQAPDYDGYEQTCMHVADVVSAEPAGSGPFEIVACCRNRFSEGDELEVLRPGKPALPVTVRNLTWLPEADEDGAVPPAEAVAVANRSKGIYRFDAETAADDREGIGAGCFLRSRTFRRSARSGAV